MKDYKKILEGVVNIINTAEKSDIGFANICTYIGENCPELKKSENESIRKALIHLVNSNKELSFGIDNYDGIKWGDILAWLEKQGEHANFRNDIQIGDKVTRNEDGVLVNLSQLNRVAKKDEKQGEQKLTWSEEDEVIVNSIISFCDFKVNIELHNEEVKNTSKNILSWLNKLKYRVQPKQEWSEEDEKAINDIMWIIEAYRKDGFNETHKQMANNAEELLKSLRPQSHWKPSEEGERMWSQIINEIEAIKSNSSTVFEKNIAQDKIDFLKNLKDRYTWKPSEEQMKILNEVLNFAANHENSHWNDYIFGTLHNLIIQLKKLREE